MDWRPRLAALCGLQWNRLQRVIETHRIHEYPSGTLMVFLDPNGSIFREMQQTRCLSIDVAIIQHSIRGEAQDDFQGTHLLYVGERKADHKTHTIVVGRQLQRGQQNRRSSAPRKDNEKSNAVGVGLKTHIGIDLCVQLVNCAGLV